MENKQRIISITNDGKQFFIYFDGTTHYDEDQYGRPVERENFEYLDENFNKFVLNGDFETTKSIVHSAFDQILPDKSTFEL